MASVRVGPEGLRQPSRIGEPRNETDQKALATLLSALRSEAEARLGCPEPSRLESLLHSGEGSDVVVHTRGSSDDGLRLHSDIARLSSPLFAPDISNLHLNWTEPAAHALAIFMYTGRVVVPTHLLYETYRAAREAGVRALCCLLRTYSYYPLRLTSADHARHIRRFATQAGLSRLRSLADHYATHLAPEPATVTLVLPVRFQWLQHRTLFIGRAAMAVAFKRRPAFEHESSSSLVLRAADEPNVCVRLPCEDPGNAHGTDSEADSSSSGSGSSGDESNGPLDGSNSSSSGANRPDASDGTVWLYVTCPKRKAAAVMDRLLGELREGVSDSAKDQVIESWTLTLERGEVLRGETPSELESMLAPETNGHSNSAPSNKGKLKVGVCGASVETLARLLAATDTLHFSAKEGSVQVLVPSLSAAKDTLRRLACNRASEAAQEYGNMNGRAPAEHPPGAALRARAPQSEVKTLTPLL